jgi:hypothetical protein
MAHNLAIVVVRRRPWEDGTGVWMNLYFPRIILELAPVNASNWVPVTEIIPLTD